MNRIWAMLLVLAVLVVLAVNLVEVRTDADAIFAADTLDLNTLDMAIGRELIIALVSPHQDARTEVALEIADILALDPAVTAVNAGPGAFSEAFLDWVWQRRLRLALPQSDDLTEAGLSHHLAQARDSLTSTEGMIFADLLLRDPTGSFSRLIQRIADATPVLDQYEGVWRSRDGEAALLFVTLADHDFEAGEIAALTDRIREQASAAGMTVYLLGPRVISAEISAETARESTRAALIASGLLLVWLLWALRSLRALLLAVLPLAYGVAIACLTVQLLFGSVHVVALGFGGVLTGLALDYSLHLMGHSGTTRSETERLVLLGALTTAVAFLTMLGSDVLALMETGVFVATGLPIAALLSRTTPAHATLVLRAPPFERLTWNMPFRRAIESLTLIVGVAVVVGMPGNGPASLFEPPDHVVETIEAFADMVVLPSGRHAVLVEGADLSELLTRQSRLELVLDEAVSAGDIDGYAMLSQFMPVTAVLPDLVSQLPSSETFGRRAAIALRENGMVPEFVDTQIEDYRLALEAPAITLAELAAFPETRQLAGSIDVTPDGVREIVRLFGPTNVNSLADAIAARDIPGVRLVDLAAPIVAGMMQLRRHVLMWLGIGSFAAFGVLLVGQADWRRTVSIARTTGAAVVLTAVLMTLITGSLGIFQIVALTLVFGIGIDYGLFLGRTGSADTRIASFRSVGLCAVSTLLAFSIMAVSPVKLLHEIGLTVFLGVLITLLLHSGRALRSSVLEK